MTKTFSRQKFKYLEKEKGFEDEIKSIEGNKKILYGGRESDCKNGYNFIGDIKVGLFMKNPLKISPFHFPDNFSSLPICSNGMFLCVCFACLHHFYQQYSCFPERT